MHLSEKAVEPPGEARADLDIFLDYSRRMGFRRNDGRPLLEWDGPEDAYRAWQECSRGRPCDYTGISYDDLRRESGIHWPRREGESESQTRLYTDFEFPSHPDYCESYGHDLLTGASVGKESFSALRADGKALLKSAPFTGPHESPDEEYPLQLTTGRSVYHFHTRTKTGRTPELNAAAPEVWLELAAEDAEARGVGEGDLVEVVSRRGRLVAPARIGHIRQGTVFAPFHYGYWDAPPGAEERHPTAANELTAHGVGPGLEAARVQIRHRRGAEAGRALMKLPVYLSLLIGVRVDTGRFLPRDRGGARRRTGRPLPLPDARRPVR